ncbi:olfactory receptor 1086-like [Tachyglossus aculeatus]|uniref:olfactory receptor 1086-like n=1 Tax=Tachyglossus aculeatus TaxID=9261 RepID=UPI0018F5836C|nr:olfactory receptor 1086-like [Tachyglossus aculeatus]
MLTNLLLEKKVISFAGYAAQMYFCIALITAEGFILTAMSYDCFVVICNPLMYTIIMSPKTCVSLVIGNCLDGFLHSALHTDFTFSLPFCGSNEISHFFCCITPLLSLSSSDTSLTELLPFNFVLFIEVIMVIAILTSYAAILSTILRINCTRSKCKAFSTCAAHLAAMSIYHGTVLFISDNQAGELEKDHAQKFAPHQKAVQPGTFLEANILTVLALTSGAIHYFIWPYINPFLPEFLKNIQELMKSLSLSRLHQPPETKYSVPT